MLSFGDFTLGASFSAAISLLAMLVRADRREARMTRTIYAWLRVWVETWGEDPVLVKAKLMAVVDRELKEPK